MSNRKNWPLALSVGPGEMNASALDAMAAAGIFQAELSSGQIGPYFNELDFPRRGRALVSMAREHGVEITSLHLPFLPFVQLDPASPLAVVRKNVVEKQTALLAACGEAGIKLAVIHPSAEPYPEPMRPRLLEAAIDTLGKLCEAARENGVTLLAENLPRTCLGRTSDEMLRFLGAIPDLRAVFDTNHSLQEDNVHFIRALGDKILSLHVSDYDFADERHWLPLEGKNGWESIFAALEDVGYEGRFLYELRSGYSYAQIAENYRRLLGTENG